MYSAAVGGEASHEGSGSNAEFLRAAKAGRARAFYQEPATNRFVGNPRAFPAAGKAAAALVLAPSQARRRWVNVRRPRDLAWKGALYLDKVRYN